MVKESDNTGIQIELVSAEHVDHRWPLVVERVVGCLRKAPSDFSAGDVWTQCRSGTWFLFLAWDDEQQVIGFSIWRFTGNGYFACVLLAGQAMAKWWPETVALATEIAQSHGCKGLAGTGRPGLVKEIRNSLPQTKIARIAYVADF